MDTQDTNKLVEVKIEEEEKPDIIDLEGPVIEQDNIEQFVNKLQRYEIDKLIEHIDEKVLTGDFSTKLGPSRVLQEIEKLDIEDSSSFNMKRYAIIYNIVDSLSKKDLDLFLEIVELKIESGLSDESKLESSIYDEDNTLENVYNCHACFEGFDCIESLEIHVEKSHLTIPVTFCCSICDEQFQNKNNLCNHIKEVHCSDQIKCFECEELFESEELLSKHMVELHNDQTIRTVCHICDQAIQESSLAKHIISKHENKSDVKNDIICANSGDGFGDSEINRKQHDKLSSNILSVGSNLKCKICDKIFGSSETLERHIKRLHTEKEGPKEFCYVCITYVRDLKMHMKSHEEKKFQCEKCPKRYRTKFDLKTHVKSVHLGVKEPCPHCGKMTANLKKHVYGNHMHEFPCEICGKVFARQTQLNYHLRAHERGTIIEKATPDVIKEKKKLANLKYLEKRRERKKEDKELHEHEKTLKRIWAKKNREKLMKYKREYYERKREGSVKHFKVGEGGVLKEEI